MSCGIVSPLSSPFVNHATPETETRTHLDREKNRPKLEARILLEEQEDSYHAPHRVGENDLFHNKLIFDAQDEIDNSRERLIGSIEGKLKSKASEEELFTIRWSLT